MDILYQRAGGKGSLGVFIEECSIRNMGNLYYPEEPKTVYMGNLGINLLEMRMLPGKCIKGMYEDNITGEEVKYLRNISLNHKTSACRSGNAVLYYADYDKPKTGKSDYIVLEAQDISDELIFVVPRDWRKGLQ
ncbi:MAG: hypothetical protein JXJ19_09480 [Elusimicrobia bacterium]|nr:hypothetical protein [Elusimicrobiota bacterium]